MTKPSAGGPLYFPTNRFNVIPAITRGLILPAAAYDKYYSDLLEIAPPWIPLLTTGIDATISEAMALSQAASFPVLAEITETELDTDTLPTLHSEARLLEPLAVAVQSAIPLFNPVIHFRSESELEEFAARHYANMNPDELKLSVTPELFEAPGIDLTTLTGWLQSLPTVDSGSVSIYREVDVTMGTSVMALHGATDADTAATAAANSTAMLGSSVPDTLNVIEPTSDLGGLVAEGAANVRLLNAILAAIATDPSSAREAPRGFVDTIAGSIDQSDDPEGEIAGNLDRIKKVLIGEAPMRRFKPTGLGAAKALLLFLLQPEPEESLSWRQQDTGATSGELALVAAFAGASRGYSGLSTNLRGEDELRRMVANAAADRINGAAGGISPAFVKKPAQIKSTVANSLPGWRTVTFRVGRTVLTKHEAPEQTTRGRLLRLDLSDPASQEEALAVARTLNWPDCIRTVLRLGHAEISHRNDMIEISVLGRVEAIENVDQELFHSKLKKARPEVLDRSLMSPENDVAKVDASRQQIPSRTFDP